MEINIQNSADSNVRQVEIRNPKTGEKALILPEIGATLVDLHLSFECNLVNLIYLPGKELIHENSFHPSALLSPWVNRVRNGNYSFEGRNYQLLINETKLGNAIHGFLARKPFTISQKETTNEFAKVSFTHHYKGDIQGYPFPFIFTLMYKLTSKGIFTVNFNCKNTGLAKMPFACGWHPYFTIANAEVKNLEIKFNPTIKYISDAQMIPMAEEFVSFPNPIRFSETTLDNVFKLASESFHVTELIDNTSKISLFIKQNSKKFPFLVVYVPENENCVAIEPMTGNTDAFNNEDGLICLSPLEEFDSSVEIWIDSAKIR